MLLTSDLDNPRSVENSGKRNDAYPAATVAGNTIKNAIASATGFLTKLRMRPSLRLGCATSSSGLMPRGNRLSAMSKIGKLATPTSAYTHSLPRACAA